MTRGLAPHAGPPDRAGQRLCLGDQRIDAVERGVEHPAQRRTRRGRGQGLNLDAGRREMIERQIDAVEIFVVVLAVLQVVDDL